MIVPKDMEGDGAGWWASWKNLGRECLSSALSSGVRLHILTCAELYYGCWPVGFIRIILSIDIIPGIFCGIVILQVIFSLSGRKWHMFCFAILVYYFRFFLYMWSCVRASNEKGNRNMKNIINYKLGPGLFLHDSLQWYIRENSVTEKSLLLSHFPVFYSKIA